MQNPVYLAHPSDYFILAHLVDHSFSHVSYTNTLEKNCVAAEV